MCSIIKTNQDSLFPSQSAVYTSPQPARKLPPTQVTEEEMDQAAPASCSYSHTVQGWALVGPGRYSHTENDHLNN